MHGLQKEHAGDLKVTIENATKPEIKQMITTEYGFKTHGMVFKDAAGTVKKTLSGHNMREPEIRAALSEVMAAEPVPAD